MPGYNCEACGENFPMRIGLTVHQNHCNGKSGSSARLKSLKAANVRKKKQEMRNKASQPVFLDEQDFNMDQDDLDPPALFDAPLELPAGTARKKRLPKRFVDHLPSTASSSVLPTTSLPHLLDHVPVTIPGTPVAPAPDLPPEDLREPHTTPLNGFGMYRCYTEVPTDDPDDFLELEDVCDSPNHAVPQKKAVIPFLPSFFTSVYAPFKNATTYLLTNWANREVKEKSNDEMDELVHGVICHPEFKIEDLQGYNQKREHDRLDKSGDEPEGHSALHSDAWRAGSVKLRLPAEDRKRKRGGEENAPEVEISGIYHCPLLPTILRALDDAEAPPMHFSPYKEFWRHADGSSECVFGEAYASDSWLQAHEEIQSLPREGGIENCVLPIILYSDSTHLATFGTASLWPIYMYFAGQSKYMRSKITEAACHHLAYIPPLPALVQEAYKKAYGRTASGQLLTHLKRELVHAILRLVLFQADFLEAYAEGFVFLCTDQVVRRLFPRFIFYSADYPERMLMATLRNNGIYSSAVDLIQKKHIHLLGTSTDRRNRVRLARVDNVARRNKITEARKAIFDRGLTIESAKVKNMLEEGSLVPVHNAFSILSEYGFNLFGMFVPDVMHEFELGVWKNIFTHLIRILVANGGDAVSDINKRYRETPTFGTNTIRRFTDNTAAMRKLAARDFEDILQCALPVFEGVLPKRHNTIILDLLFVLATWHAYAKLRIHTDTTVRLFDQATTDLGKQVRHFKKKTCAEYDTRELGREVIARGRREAAMLGKNPTAQKKTGAKQKELNINTPKFHALGGYAGAVRQFGTSDSYSTQIGETQHKRVKRLFGRSNRQNAARDISKLEARVRRLRDIHDRIAQARAFEAGNSTSPLLASGLSEPLPKSDPQAHYQIAASNKLWTNPYSWASGNQDDPALRDFMSKLRSHLLGRLLSRDEEAPFFPDEIAGLHIKRDRLYRHKVIRINYTSYDLRRLQDSLNPRTHSDVMLLAENVEAQVPYVYARILGLFHADIAYVGPGSNSHNYKRMDIAWIRWFQVDSSYSSGFTAKRLHRIQFVPHTDPSAFGFLDPELIIRAAHLIPDFSSGYTHELLPPSIARQYSKKKDEDYLFYYVNIFADRDMFMRYRGGGIGHKATWHLNDILTNDNSNETMSEDEMDEDEIPAEITAVKLEANESENEDNISEDGSEENRSDSEAEDNEDEGGVESEGYADL